MGDYEILPCRQNFDLLSLSLSVRMLNVLISFKDSPFHWPGSLPHKRYYDTTNNIPDDKTKENDDGFSKPSILMTILPWILFYRNGRNLWLSFNFFALSIRNKCIVTDVQCTKLSFNWVSCQLYKLEILWQHSLCKNSRSTMLLLWLRSLEFIERVSVCTKPTLILSLLDRSLSHNK